MQFQSVSSRPPVGYVKHALALHGTHIDLGLPPEAVRGSPAAAALAAAVSQAVRHLQPGWEEHCHGGTMQTQGFPFNNKTYDDGPY